VYGLDFAKVVLEAPKIVYATCLKTHRLAQFTMSLKLAVAFMRSRERLLLHMGHIGEKIAELNTLVAPDLILTDGRKCCISGGPTAGECREPGLVLASGDRIAIDVEGLRILQSYAGNSLAGANDVCGFVESGTLSIAWDGGVSPCWPLMHSHTSYLHGKPRRSRRHVVGWVGERPLMEIWHDPEYVAYRERVQSFGFAPCTFCGGCEMSERNEEDCFGNTFPACGGCLWAQGVIQCP
jgi:hypothetical protein